MGDQPKVDIYDQRYVPLKEHMEALQAAESRFQEERDRRYSEVNTEREKALKIKEEADKVALDLARQIQTYKDEQANELREQINTERGSYATKEDIKVITDKFETALLPLTAFVSASGGRAAGISSSFAGLATLIVVIVGIIGLAITIILNT